MHHHLDAPTAVKAEDGEHLRPVSDIRFREVLGEGIVVRQRAGEVLVLNEVGIRILQLISEGQRRSQIIATLSAEFETEEDVLRQDVADFCGQLLEAGVLEVEPSEAASPEDHCE